MYIFSKASCGAVSMVCLVIPSISLKTINQYSFAGRAFLSGIKQRESEVNALLPFCSPLPASSSSGVTHQLAPINCIRL